MIEQMPNSVNAILWLEYYMVHYIENKRSLLELLRADLIRQHTLSYGDYLPQPAEWRLWLGMLSPRFIPVFLCRTAHALYCNHLSFIAKLVALINFFAYGIEISIRCPIGPGLYLPHTHGTVIGAWEIGTNVTIFQGVTLGAKEIDFTYTQQSRPTIGDGVIIGAGAKVLGGVLLENDVCVGANSVVLSSLPEACLAVGIPARVKKIRKIPD